MALVKHAGFEVLSAQMGGSWRVATFKRAHRHDFKYEPRQNYLYVRSRAISSRTNDNHDNFPAEEIRTSYRTFVGKPVFVNHRNENHKRARGVIIDAALHEDTNPDGTPDTWVEVLMEVDAVSFPKLAQAILAGHVDRTSMGCDVAYSLCSVCGNRAETPLDYCAHIPKMKGMKFTRTTASGGKEEVLCYEKCYGLRFFENSLLVEDPADPTAYFLGVDDRGVGGGYRGDLATTAARQDMVRKVGKGRGDINMPCGFSQEQSDGSVWHCILGRGHSDDYPHRFARWGATAPLEAPLEAMLARMGVDADDASLDTDYYASRFAKLAYGEQKAPPEVDTLRDEKCPICFGPDALVRTRDGYVPIASIEAGDEVLSGDGQFHHVLEVMERDFDGLAYSLRAQVMPKPIIVTPEHPIMALVGKHLNGTPTAKGRDRCRPGACVRYGTSHVVKRGRWGSGEIIHELAWLDAEDLVVGGYVATNLPVERVDRESVDVPSFFWRPGSRGAERKGPRSYDLTDDFLWMVGLYIAEGSAGRRTIVFSLHEKEVEYVERLRLIFGGWGFRVAVLPNTGAGVNVEIYSAMLADWFRAWLGSGSDTKAIPGELLALSDDRLAHVITGVLDGDGTRSKNEIKQTSRVLAMQLVEWSLRQGMTPAVYVEQPRGKRVAYTVNGVELARTTRRWEHQGRLLSKVVEMDPVLYAGKVYNLRVDGDPTYTVQGVLVHNCGESDSYNGERCMVCGFIKPPDEFMDPDLEKAQQNDLRAETDAADPDQHDLKCDNCGATFNSHSEGATDAADPTSDNAPSSSKGLKQFRVSAADKTDPFQKRKEMDGDFKLDDDKGAKSVPDETDQAPDTAPKQGDQCPKCGEGTLQPVQVDASPTKGQTEGEESPAEQPEGVNPEEPPAETDDAKPEDGSTDEKSAPTKDADNNKDGDDKPPWMKKKDDKSKDDKSKTSQKEQSMRPALAALAEQQKRIERTEAAILALGELAGAGNHPAFVALRKNADEGNPAQPVPAPASEAPAATTQETLGDLSDADVTTPGTTNLTDVSPDATTSLQDNGVVLDEPLDLNEQDPTRPVSGTESQRPLSETKIETDVRAPAPPNAGDTMFPLQGPMAQPAGRAANRNPSEPRQIAAIRLARLRIQAGIAQAADDLALAAAIASSPIDDASLAAEVRTLEAVIQANPRQAAGPAGQRVATRSTPSLASVTAGANEDAPSTASPFKPTSEEFLFE